MAKIKDWLMEMEALVFDAMEMGIPRANVYAYVSNAMHGASERDVEYIIEDINNKFNFNEKDEYTYVA
jgi:hypothetical protein